MLVLSSKRNDTIVVGPDVTITVLEIRGDKVRLGVEAPEDVEVDRSEVRARKRRHTDGELEVMAGLVRGEPLHRLEQRMDFADNACRPSESDMISAPRARAMARQVETLQRSIEYLRCENAELRAQVQDKEHVE